MTCVPQNPAPPPRPQFADLMSRFRTVLNRHARMRIKNPVTIGMPAVAAALGLLIAWVVAKSPIGASYSFVTNSSFIYFLKLMPIVAFFLGMVSAGTEFVVERRLIRHENRFGVPVTVVIVSKVLILGAFAAIETLALLLPALIYLYFPVSMNLGAFLLIFALTLCVNWVGIVFGLLTSALAPNLKVAFAFVPLALIPQIVFGSLIPYEEMSTGARWSPLNLVRPAPEEPKDAPFLAQIMPARWGAEGMVVASLASVYANVGTLRKEQDSVCRSDCNARHTQDSSGHEDCLSGCNYDFNKSVEAIRTKFKANEKIFYQTKSNSEDRDELKANVFAASQREMLGQTFPTPLWSFLVLFFMTATLLVAVRVALGWQCRLPS